MNRSMSFLMAALVLWALAPNLSRADIVAPVPLTYNYSSLWGSVYVTVDCSGGDGDQTTEMPVDLMAEVTALPVAWGYASLQHYEVLGSISGALASSGTGYVEAGAFFDAAGTIEIGTSEGYPAGSPLPIEVGADSHNTSGSGPGWEFEIWRDDPEAPLLSMGCQSHQEGTITAVAGETLNMSLLVYTACGSSGGQASDRFSLVIPEPSAFTLGILLGAAALLRHKPANRTGGWLAPAW